MFQEINITNQKTLTKRVRRCNQTSLWNHPAGPESSHSAESLGIKCPRTLAKNRDPVSPGQHPERTNELRPC